MQRDCERISAEPSLIAGPANSSQSTAHSRQSESFGRLGRRDKRQFHRGAGLVFTRQSAATFRYAHQPGGRAGKNFVGGRGNYFQSKKSKIETVAENHFGDEMIGGCSDADTEAEIYFPLGR